MAVQFGPKILGLNARIFGTVLGSPGTNFRFVIGPCVLLCVIPNMNNMLVVCKLCYYMRILYINMNWYEIDISHFICTGTP